MIQECIRDLVRYGRITGLVEPEDEIYTVNRLLELFELDEYEYAFGQQPEGGGLDEAVAVAALPDILEKMMDYAVAEGIMKEDGIGYRFVRYKNHGMSGGASQ